MKIKLTHGECQSVYTALSMISSSGKELKSATSFAIAFTLDSISESIQHFNKKRKEIVEQYAKKDKDGKIVMEKDNPDQPVLTDTEKAEKDLTDLLDSEVAITLDDEDLLTREKLRNEKEGHIKPQHIVQLAPLFKAMKKDK